MKEITVPSGIFGAVVILTADKMGFPVGFVGEARRYFIDGVMPQPSLLLHFERAIDDAKKAVLKAGRGDEADKIAEGFLDLYLSRQK